MSNLLNKISLNSCHVIVIINTLLLETSHCVLSSFENISPFKTDFYLNYIKIQFLRNREGCVYCNDQWVSAHKENIDVYCAHCTEHMNAMFGKIQNLLMLQKLVHIG